MASPPFPLARYHYRAVIKGKTFSHKNLEAREIFWLKPKAPVLTKTRPGKTFAKRKKGGELLSIY